MEGNKNNLTNNKKTYKAKKVNTPQKTEEEVNTYKNNQQKINKPEENKNKNLLSNKENLAKENDMKMHIDSQENSDEEYYTESSGEDEDIVIDENFDDNSEDFEELPKKSLNNDQDDTETKEKKIKVNIWDEDKKIKDDEKLDFDNEAYEMLHRAKIEWPCMSIDFILPENFSNPISNFYSNDKSRLNISKDAFPYNSYLVAGSQTTSANGFVYLMKWFNMHKTKYDDDPDKAAESDEEEGTEPYMKFEKFQINGNVNKLETMKNSYLCALWSDSPSVEIIDLRKSLEDLENSEQITNEDFDAGNFSSKNKKRKLNEKNFTLKSFKRSSEGYGIKWSNLIPGVLAAGGQDKKVEIYIPTDESCSDWVLNSNNVNNSHGILKGHKGSIEGLAWSPNQNFVLASCSTDKSLRFWDLRTDKNNPPIIIEGAHESDVNCISWNSYCDFMVASGSDDNSFKVWDIRYIKNGPITNIKWHKGPITSIAWDPYDESQLAVASEDNRLSIWDFAVEADDCHLFDAQNQEIPQQLIFLHQGQENVKELKFHPVYKNFLVSTAENGLNIFKPAFDDEDEDLSDEDNMKIDN